MRERQTRRKYLLTLGATSVVGLTGCSQTTNSEPETPESENLSSAAFSFEYRSEENQISIQYDGGANIIAGDLQIRSSSGLEVQWPQLGSTVASPEDLIEPGATAVLGETILNWGEAMNREDTVRLVHVGGDAPATLGRFSPPESSPLTSTVPSTSTPEPTETPTPEDTTAPSITGFSLSNPSGQVLRVSFNSNESLSTIQISISGSESATLTTSDFSRSSTTDSGYAYEATYSASSDGDFTASLDEASDRNGNDGSNDESVSVSVETSSAVSDWPMFQYDQYNTGHQDTTISSNNTVEREWSYSTEDAVAASPIIDNGVLYVGDRSGNIYALDASSGEAVWQSKIGSKIVRSGAVTSNAILFGNEDNQLRSVSKDTGNVLWTQDLGRTALGITAINGTAYVGRSGYGKMYAVDVTTGDINWEYEARGGIQSNIAAAPAVTENKVVFGSANSYIVALNRSDGSRIWTYDSGEDGTLSSSSGNSRIGGAPSIHNNTVYAANNLGSVMSISLSDGSENWKYNASAAVSTSPCIDGDNVYVGDNDGIVYALDTTSGDAQWTFDSNESIGRSSVVSTKYNVFFGNLGGEMHSLTSSNGTPNWNYQLGGKISPLVISGNRIFATSSDQTITSFSIE